MRVECIPVELLLLEAKKYPIGTLRKYGKLWYVKISDEPGKKAWTYYATHGTARGNEAEALSKKQDDALAAGTEVPMPADLNDFVPKEAPKAPAAPPPTPTEPVSVVTPPTAPPAPTPTPEPVVAEPAPPEEVVYQGQIIEPAEPDLGLAPGQKPPKEFPPHGQMKVAHNQAKLSADAQAKAAAYVAAILNQPLGDLRVGGDRPAKKGVVEEALSSKVQSPFTEYRGTFKAMFGDKLPKNWREQVAEAWEAATTKALDKRMKRCADSYSVINKFLAVANPGLGTNAREVRGQARGVSPEIESKLVTSLGPDWKKQIEGACSTLDGEKLGDTLIPAVWTREKPRPANTKVPVSRALKVKKLSGSATSLTDHATEIQAAIDTIDMLHGDGALSSIPVVQQVMKGALGEYGQSKANTAVSITINPLGPHPEFTTAHEIGHFLDNQGLTQAFGSHNVHGSTVASHHMEVPELRDLWTALDGSAAIREWRSTLAHEVSKAVPDGVMRGMCEYYLRRSEIFARAYSQWVATAASHEKMLQRAKQQSKSGGAMLPAQWDPDDFKPIYAAMTKLFKRLGWLHIEPPE